MSAKDAKIHAAVRINHYISTIEFANERNIYLNKSEQLELERSNQGALESLKYNSSEEKYLNSVLEEFQITEDQYIEYLVNLENEYVLYYSKLYELEINQEALNQKLDVDGTPAVYFERAGISVEDAKEIQKSWDEMYYTEVTERQFHFPFDLTVSAIQVADDMPPSPLSIVLA